MLYKRDRWVVVCVPVYLLTDQTLSTSIHSAIVWSRFLAGHCVKSRDSLVWMP